jgi:thiol-disulfide isomerase/thioredoxin
MVLCAVMTGANIYLLHLNKTLRTSPVATSRSVALPAGKEVKLISGIDVDGSPMNVDPSKGKATVLMVYSPTCPYCELNWPNWSSLAKTDQDRNINFVAVDITGKAAPDFLAKKGIAQIRSMHRMDPQEIVDLNLILTPETILIGSDSKVIKAWYGVLSKENSAELNKMLSRL